MKQVSEMGLQNVRRREEVAGMYRTMKHRLIQRMKVTDRYEAHNMYEEVTSALI